MTACRLYCASSRVTQVAVNRCEHRHGLHVQTVGYCELPILKYITFISFLASATVLAWFLVESFATRTPFFSRSSLYFRFVIMAVLSFHLLNVISTGFGSPFLLCPTQWARAMSSGVHLLGLSTQLKTSVTALAHVS